ncbi:MAG: hypothetical protein JJ892_14130 [Balneola sp.]|nr:hypothetical protein [Balneola sp.]MBO6649875.1 hypothetical protein [Balneola sp.]MBO6712439.1 hypothetical protein [Balneola sp.]MBO6801410.1 hypothetical protein [Balneola sp.]MBO6871776.1 hypothetical protein [Balneola sp.]
MNKESHQKPSAQRTLPIILMALGLLLMIFMITVEDEPGGIPLLMILSGIVWFSITRFKSKTKKP